jgi:DNA helicase-2/ATP-dependent DNA helicase PcrA
VTRGFLEDLATRGELDEPLGPWPPLPDKTDPNPLQATAATAAWPPDHHTEEVQRRLVAADLVRAELERLASEAPGAGTGHADTGWHVADTPLEPDEAEVVAAWDRELDRLLEEARARLADEVEVSLPSSLSTTALAGLRDTPEQLAEALARPMPRRPSPAARFGTRFHAWVEAHFERHRQELLVDPDELSGRADLGIDDDEDLGRLIAQFEAGPFAHRTDVEIEVPFALVLGGQVVRGRIDAVFAEEDGGWLVVDWKTNRHQTADPLQLAVYRLAWAELHGLPLDTVRAAFYYVRDGEVVSYADLPGREELTQLLSQTGQPSMAARATSTMAPNVS